MCPGFACWICTLLLVAQVRHTCGDRKNEEQKPPSPDLVQYVCPGGGTPFEHKDNYPWWLATLEEVEILRSKRPRNGFNVTIVEPLSLERLAPLKLQCTIWPGIIAAVVYLPVSQGRVFSKDNSKLNKLNVHQAMELIRNEYQGMDGHCVLDLGVYFEHLPPGNETDPAFAYPINAMRNKALALAQTESVLLLDGDFIPAPLDFVKKVNTDGEFYESLTAMMRNNHAVLVLPAVDFFHHNVNYDASDAPSIEDRLGRLVEALHSNKRQLSVMAKSQLLHSFQPCCHQQTNWGRWLDATEPYEAKYPSSDGYSPSMYEPYTLALRSSLPWWDERFRGWYFNKQAYTFELYRFNFTFIVHPEGCLIHYPHPEIKDRKSQLNSTYYKLLEIVFWRDMPFEFSYAWSKYQPVRAADPAQCGLQAVARH